MKEENRKYAEEAYEIVTDAAEKIGPRLPGSEGEAKFHDYMAEKLKAIGIKPIKEEFAVSPRAGIGGLSYAGWAGFIVSVATYFAWGNETFWYLIGAFAFLAVFWLIFSCFFYKTWFDMFFPQAISQNSYGVLEPKSGKADYTIILSGHTDTSWTWRHSEHAYKYKDKPIIGIIATYGKVGFGAVCFFLITLFSIFMAVTMIFHSNEILWANKVYNAFYTNSIHFVYIISRIIPVITAFGCWFVIMWGDPKGENASRGAMDNATGIALSYEVIRYFKENPEKMPENCRIIDLNVGSEEPGLRG